MASSCNGQVMDMSPDLENLADAGYGELGQWNGGWSPGAVKNWCEGGKSRRDSVLAAVIEAEVIPRLLLAHREISELGTPPEVSSKELAEIPSSEKFAKLVLECDLPELVVFARKLLDGGLSVDRFYLDVLSPAARLMGIYWNDDLLSFTDVTMGLARLHQLLHEIGRYAERHRQSPSTGRTAYFAAAPNEQHSFGLTMVEAFFHRAGWTTSSDFGASESAILSTVSSTAFDLVGFSVGCEDLVDPLSALITRTRKVSRNRDIAIMVGGRIFQDDPTLIGRFEGVMVAQHGCEAVRLAEEFLLPAVGKASRTLM